MQNILSAILVAFNFFPGYKTKAGAVVLLGVAVGTAYNAAAPSLGLPGLPGEWLATGAVVGNAVLGVGVANKLAAK
jgi:hypothetical protein